MKKWTIISLLSIFLVLWWCWLKQDNISNTNIQTWTEQSIKKTIWKNNNKIEKKVSTNNATWNVSISKENKKIIHNKKNITNTNTWTTSIADQNKKNTKKINSNEVIVNEMWWNIKNVPSIDDLFKNRYSSEKDIKDIYDICFFKVDNLIQEIKKWKYTISYKLSFNVNKFNWDSCKLEKVEKIWVKWIHNNKAEKIYTLHSYNKEYWTFEYNISELYWNIKPNENNKYQLIFYKKDWTQYKLSFNINDLKSKHFNFEKEKKKFTKLQKIIKNSTKWKIWQYIKRTGRWCFLPKNNNYCINLQKAYYTWWIIEENASNCSKNSFDTNKKIFVIYDDCGVSHEIKVYKKGEYFVEKLFVYLWGWAGSYYTYHYYDNKWNPITLKNNNIVKKIINIDWIIYKLEEVWWSDYHILSYQSINTFKKLVDKFSIHEERIHMEDPDIILFKYIPERLTLKNKKGFIWQYKLYNNTWWVTIPYVGDGIVQYKDVWEQAWWYLILKWNYNSWPVNDLNTTKKIIKNNDYIGSSDFGEESYSHCIQNRKDMIGVSCIQNKDTKKIIYSNKITQKDLPIFKITKIKDNLYILWLTDNYTLVNGQ